MSCPLPDFRSVKDAHRESLLAVAGYLMRKINANKWQMQNYAIDRGYPLVTALSNSLRSRGTDWPGSTVLAYRPEWRSVATTAEFIPQRS